MGDVIDFKSALHRMADKDEPPAPHAGDECELTYDPKPGSVGVTVVTDATGVAHFTVTAPAAEVGQAMQAARDALVRSFGVDPSDLRTAAAVRDQLGEATVAAFTTTFVQQHFFAQALLRTVVMPFLSPDMLTDEPPVEGSDYTFKVDALLRPSYELTSYDPVAVEAPQKREISSRDVTDYLNGMADELATWENDPSRTEVADGDHVMLNLSATDSAGRELPALTGRHVPYQIGLGTIGPDFDRGLVGMKPRERRELSVSLPAAGDDGQMTFEVVSVKVQVDEIQRKVPAKIDDAWVAKNMPEAQTLLGLRGRVRTLLEREAELTYRDQMMELTATELAKRLVGEPDERYVQKMRDELVSQFISDLQRQGIDYQQFLSQPGFDEQAWEDQMTQEATAALRRGLALDSLADHLDINLEEKDIAKVVSQMAPGNEEVALRGLLDSGQMPKLCEVALRTRANEWLVDNAKPLRVVEGGAGKARAGRGDASGGILLGGDPKPAGKDGKAEKGDGPKLTLL